ncbi:MAG: biotin transporter BioY [Rhodothermales bacterium]
MIIRLTAPAPSLVDALREERASALVQVLSIAGFALLTAAAAQVRLYVWEVPFTLQTLVVFGSGLFLGWRNGMLAQLLYLAMGLFLPVFAGDGYGLGYLLAAVSAGYLFAYPLTAAVVGWLSKRWNSLTGSTVSMMAGSLIFFASGVIWLHFVAGHATWMESIDKGFLRFIPIDLAKILLVSMLYTGSRRMRGRSE